MAFGVLFLRCMFFKFVNLLNRSTEFSIFLYLKPVKYFQIILISLFTLHIFLKHWFPNIWVLYYRINLPVYNQCCIFKSVNFCFSLFHWVIPALNWYNVAVDMAQRLCRVYCDFMLDKNKGIETFIFRRKQLNSDKMKLSNFTFVRKHLFLSKMSKSKLHLINQTLSDFQLVSYSSSMIALSIITVWKK